MTLDIALGQQPNRLPPEPVPLLPAEQAWLTTLPAPPSAGGAMDDRRVYVPLQDQQITALDRETGMTVWTRDIESPWPPVLGEGRVYIAASDEFHALDVETGATVWRVPMPQPLLAPLTFDSGWLIGVYERGDVIGMRAADGAEIWRSRVGDGDAPLSAPVPGEPDAFYLTLDDGSVVALSLVDGRVLWQQRLPGRPSVPAWGRGRVYVGSSDNHFYAFDADDGKLAWKWRYGGDVIGAVADDEFVYVASLDNQLRALNRGNGNQRWRKDTGTRPIGPPDALGRLTIVPGVNPMLSAFNARTGEPTGTYVAPGDLQGRPLLDHRPPAFRVTMVLVLRNGQVVGLNSVGLLYREQASVPLTALPGVPVPREQPPQAAGSAAPQTGR